MKAIWNNVVIADSDDTVVVEGNHYFPRTALKQEYLQPSTTTSVCPWKGTASYYSLRVAGAVNQDAVWYYPQPSPAAAAIRDRVAFWKGVSITP
ncbi:MAG TPA: DUF427 domain-containing protein [Steroidobacteraceae bacterium]|jgi:uncharacterized protein (DUF427 family)